jgi:metal-sulfur cluster biosynthetic enzyme
MFWSGVQSLEQAQQVTMMITVEDVLAALRSVQDPELGRDLVS